MSLELKIPAIGESITEVEIGDWRKNEGDPVQKDETIAILESEKATVELPAPAAGTVTKILKRKGQTAAVGEVIAHLDDSKPVPAPKPAPTGEREKESPKPEKDTAKTEVPPRVMPAAQRVLAETQLPASEIKATGPGGRLLKEDVLRHLESPAPTSDGRQPSSPAAPAKSSGPPAEAPKAPATPPKKELGSREEEVVPMSRLRRTVAERLVAAQHNAALLTTFNEIDMSAVTALRKQYGETFQQRYGTKLGFMSFFVKAVIDALKLIPQVNAEIRGKDVVYKNYYDIGVAIGGGKGLVVPVLRNAERMSFAEIELAIADLAKRAKENTLKIDELQGGTFTITNGGIYGSLLSTPIINPPQSGILGMHAIQERPVAQEGQVVIRPMMYVALTYDHRLVDGREAVTFLKRVKEAIEAPARMLIEV
ncbi:MAG: 2-oxoglutarate dehydrogenase complex dihydrolipoyllysine-residue succinyltransferase [Verrucomicrobiales bacterium]|nr:2-oxoglutarate dehydrogenase complex dihydrolipoyllysine-residue succinyltransferase [Verrucomicrobiales bacterium]